MSPLRSRKLAAIAAFAIGAAALSGCGPDYDRTELSAVKPDPFGGTITKQSLEVHEGMIVKANVSVWNDDNERMTLEIVADNPAIVAIEPVVSYHDYTFIGKAVGTTQIRIYANDELVLTVPANVKAQPSLP